MTAMFQHVEGDSAVLVQGGVYKPCDIYVRNDGELYAKASGGFVRLYEDGATSKSGVRLDALISDKQLYRDRFGRLCFYASEGRKPVAEEAKQKLLPKD